MFCFRQTKKEVFDWIKSGQKTIELRKGKAKKGDEAVFQCGRSIVRGRIIRREEGALKDVLIIENTPSFCKRSQLQINLTYAAEFLV